MTAAVKTHSFFSYFGAWTRRGGGPWIPLPVHHARLSAVGIVHHGPPYTAVLIVP